jgi:hypothetical protein
MTLLGNGAGAWIIDGDRGAFLGGEARQIALAFRSGGHAAVLAEWRGRALPRSVEKDHVFGVVLDHMGDIGRTHKGEAKLILRVAGLRLLLRFDGERGGIQRAVSTGPEEGAVGLIGLEVAEIAEATAKSTAAATASASASSALHGRRRHRHRRHRQIHRRHRALRRPVRHRQVRHRQVHLGQVHLGHPGPAKRLVQLRVLAKLFHVHAGEGIRRA